MAAETAEGTAGAPIVKIDALRKSFGANEVLKGIDMQVQRGEVIAIIGKDISPPSPSCRITPRGRSAAMPPAKAAATPVHS